MKEAVLYGIVTMEVAYESQEHLEHLKQDFQDMPIGSSLVKSEVGVIESSVEVSSGHSPE